jgi:type VI secretion system protein ImpA
MVAVDNLIQPIQPDSPCGDDLEYDDAFTDLERSAEGPSVHAVVGGDVATDGPNWRAVEKQATALLARTKDLRVAVPLVKAALHTHGLAGFSTGCAFLLRLLERYWESIHPRLDPDDGNDPLMRINALRGLCDRVSVLVPLRGVPLVSVQGLGSVCLRDLESRSASSSDSAGSLPPATIDAIFGKVELDQLRETALTVRALLENLQAIEQYITDKVGHEHTFRLEALTSLLQRIEDELRTRLRPREAALLNAAQGDGHGDPSAHAGSNNGAGTRGQPSPIQGEIGSRDDVVRMLDKLCAYYERHEPSSPIPLLLRRAKRLVPMSFFDIVRDLAPAGVSQIETFRGPEETQTT